MSLSLLFVYYLKPHLLSSIVDILCLFTFLCILEINYHYLGPPKHISILCNLKETTTYFSLCVLETMHTVYSGPFIGLKGRGCVQPDLLLLPSSFSSPFFGKHPSPTPSSFLINRLTLFFCTGVGQVSQAWPIRVRVTGLGLSMCLIQTNESQTCSFCYNN